MEKAVWIIAITEVVRSMQNTVQLCMLVEERHRSREQQDKAFAVYEEAMNRTDERWDEVVQDRTWR